MAVRESLRLAKSRRLREAYERARRESPPGAGGRFRALASSVADYYRRHPEKLRPGQTPEEAGKGVAAFIGRKKYGKAQMTKWSVAGRKKARGR